MSASTIGMILVAVTAAMAVAVIVQTRIVERRHPPLGKFVTCDGVRLHYVERGAPDAPALVVLHGNGSMVADFLSSGVVDLLAQRHRVLCFDRPGFGYSSRPRLRSWTPEAQAALIVQALARLGVTQPIILGHSWGALVALAVALGHTNAARGLVLVAGYYFPTRRIVLWLAAIPALPVVGDLLRHTIMPLCGWPVARFLVRLNFAPRPVPQRFAAEFPLGLCLRPRALRALAEESGLMIPAARRLARRYQDLRCPVAIVAGGGDLIVEPEHAPRLKEVLCCAPLTIVPAAGHMVHHAAPERIAEAVAVIEARCDA
jgi:pimeloyl-ACP methyl ester carboxylesterase